MVTNTKEGKRVLIIAALIIEAAVLIGLFYNYLSKKADLGVAASYKQVTDVSDCIALERGDYTVTIVYSCDADCTIEPYSDTHPESLRGGEVTLSRDVYKLRYKFACTEDIDNFRFRINEGDGANLSISKLKVRENADAELRLFVIFICLFACADLICADLLCRRSSFIKGHLKEIACVAAVTLVSSIVVFLPMHNGADLCVHMTRIEGIAHELADGHFPVRMQSYWTHGFGYPMSIFYGDALLYIPAILRILGFSITACYNFYLVMINFGTALISFVCFKRMFGSVSVSTVTAMVYSTSLYRYHDVYGRAAVGEYTAIMFIPLVALGVYLIYTETKRRFRNSLILASGMAGIVTSHTLTLMMCCIVILIVCLIFIKKTLRRGVIFSFLWAAGFTALWSLWFLVPFADYYLNEEVNINSSQSAALIQDEGARIIDYFNFFDAEGLKFLTPGIVLMAVLAVGIFMCFKTYEKKYIFLTGMSLFLLFLSSNLFPWNFISEASSFGNILAQIQFPWRYLEFAVLFMTLLLGTVLTTRKKKLHINVVRISLVMNALCVASTLIFAASYYKRADVVDYYDTEEIGYLTDYLYSRTSVNDDGTRTDTNLRDLNTIIVTEPTIEEFYFVGDNAGLERQIYVRTGAVSETVQLPVFNYTGWHIEDEAGNEYEISDGLNFRIMFEVPANFDGILTLYFREPWYWRLAEIVSLFGIVVCTVIFVCKRRTISRGK